MNQKLVGKRAFITGGSEGIGYAIAKAFLAEGAHVVIAARRELVLRDAANQLGHDCGFAVMDLGDPQQVEAAIASAVKQLGGLDILVNNAAITSPSKTVETTSLEELQALLDVNLRGSFWAMQKAYPYLKESKGNVLNLSSMAGVSGQAQHAAYAMTKGGLNALTKSAAVDWGADGIRVNALCPAGTWTPALRRWCGEQKNPAEVEADLDRLHVLGFCPEADDVAPVALFLCSSDARFVTGHVQHVSGGSECGYRL